VPHKSKDEKEEKPKLGTSNSQKSVSKSGWGVRQTSWKP